MKSLILASAVVVLILSASIGQALIGQALTGYSTGGSYDADDLQSVMAGQSLALFFPAGNLITTDVVESNEEGC